WGARRPGGQERAGPLAGRGDDPAAEVPGAERESEPVEVRLLDKSYLVACAEDEREGLLRAARLLDERLRQMKSRDKSASLERIAVLAALNFAHEKLQSDAQASQGQQALARLLTELGPRIDRVLAAVGQR